MEEIQDSAEVKPDSIYESPTRKDVFGKAGEFVEDFIDAVSNETLYQIMGVNGDKTFLLYGPPGTGKTLATSAITNQMNRGVLLRAHEQAQNVRAKIKATDFGMMSFSYDISRYGTAYINMGSRIIQDFFDKVGMFAQMGVKVLIKMDECDALFQSRTSHVQTHTEDRKCLETLMKNIQVVHDTPNEYLIAMTNIPDICDDAVLRSGRIDRKIKFELPKYHARTHAFEVEIEKTNERALYRVIRGAKPEILGEMTEGFNYADIVNAVRQAVVGRAREYAKEETQTLASLCYVSQRRLEAAVESVRGSRKSRRKIGYGNNS